MQLIGSIDGRVMGAFDERSRGARVRFLLRRHSVDSAAALSRITLGGIR
jgi:hypothetical protein